MDNATRKQLAAIVAVLEDVQSKLESEDMAGVKDAADAEREKFDNMSDGLQASERGQKIEAAADALDEAADKISEAIDALQEAVGNITTAQE
jgi:acyl-CoA reductase-like NAD-dependent aldehyde dehydrogenase